MFIPIPIYIGNKNIASFQGTVWKHVCCEHCREEYAYALELEATGEDEDFFFDRYQSQENALRQAIHNFNEKGRNYVLPVPCPSCGMYQQAMTKRLKEDAAINRFQIAGAIIALLSLVPLAFGGAIAWALTLLLGVTGVALLAYGYWVAWSFDPNAGNPHERKAFGQQHSVWGAQLAELLSRQAAAKQI